MSRHCVAHRAPLKLFAEREGYKLKFEEPKQPMRYVIFFIALYAAFAPAGCKTTLPENRNAQISSGARSSAAAPVDASASTQNEKPNLPIASAHGGSPPASGGFDIKRGGNSDSAATPNLDTTALDARIEQVERKAKAPNATEADRRAAAAAYLERANLFYEAQTPSLYKFALRDFRRTLRYDPENAEAQAKRDTIVSIYESMHRTVPDLGNEP